MKQELDKCVLVIDEAMPRGLAANTFQTLRRQLAELEFADVAAVDFTDLAQSCRTYGEFIEKMARTGPGELRYLGMALLGPRHQVDRLTGSLPLLR